MNTLWTIDTLYKDINHATPVTVVNNGNSAVLFSETGARILGLFPSTSAPNTLWVPPDISSRFTDNDWLLGGERQWIAPQQDYFFTNARAFDGFLVQQGIDPGMYTKKDTLQFENTFTLHNYRINKTCSNCVSKRKFTIIENDPYKSSLDFAGITINDSLLISDAKTSYSAWSVAMVATQGDKHPGTILFPVANESAVVNYFNPVPSERFSMEKQYAKFIIDSKDAYKLAVRPEGIDWENPVKIIYAAPFDNSGLWYCVVKRSIDLPRIQDDCVDIPPHDQPAPKGAVQAYNHGYGSEMRYGEIELQFHKGNAKKASFGEHELLSYCGKKKSILELLRVLLRTDTLPAVY